MPTMGQVRMKIYAIFRSVILLSLVGAAQSAGADATPPDYEIVKLKKDSSGLFEVEARRSFTVVQEIRRHYQTKSYSSERVLLSLDCRRSQVNVISYQWYADKDLHGPIVHASHEQSGWYSTSKDAAVDQMAERICPDQ
jgi:hypothetical protein